MPGDGEAMDLRMPLLPGELKGATPPWATHALGKWHIGFRTEAHLPTSRGFDSFFGLLAGGADHYTKTLEPCGGASNAAGEMENCTCGKHSSATLPFRVDFTDGTTPAKKLWDTTTYDAYQFGARAVELVEQHDTATPFFLYWAPHKVHSPLQAPAEFLAPYPIDPGHPCDSTPETCAQRGYGTAGAGCGCKNMCYCNRRLVRAMVTAVDAMLTNLTAALQAAGMWESTYIIFLGDNGGPSNNANSNTEFRGQKFGHWEGGHRGVFLFTVTF